MPIRQVVSPSVDNPAALISPAVRWGDLLFASGQVAIDPTTMTIIGSDFETQVRVALDALVAVMHSAGTGPENILRLECFLANADDFGHWNTVFAEYFPLSPPARTTLVAGFVLPGLLIEVQAIAGIPSRSEGKSL